MKRLRNRIRGFAIVTAIFILVVLATLGAFIVNVFSSQQIGSALDLEGVRAYQAARAGIEWGIYRVQISGGYNFGHGATSPDPRSCGDFPASFSPTAPTLSTFTVTVTCNKISDSSGGPNVYSLVSVACNGPNAAEPRCPNVTNPGAYYVERRLEAAL
jgi:MSHA biogenesis protein MshP